MSGLAQPEETAELDAELAAIQVEGHWKSNQDGLPAEPGGAAEPYLWRWADLYPGLLKASELLGNEAGASRRTLRLCTPGLAGKATTRTIHTSIQMVKPGEVAKMHRHSISAFRFVIGGAGGITAVDGQRFVMNLITRIARRAATVASGWRSTGLWRSAREAGDRADGLGKCRQAWH